MFYKKINFSNFFFFLRIFTNYTFLYKYIRWKVARRPNLLVYPEGHRMFNAPKAGKLKIGLITVLKDFISLKI